MAKIRIAPGFFYVSGVYFVNVSWLPIGQQCLKLFFRPRALASICWRNLQNVRYRQRKLSNAAPPNYTAAFARSQQILMQVYYTPLLMSNCWQKQATNIIKPIKFCIEHKKYLNTFFKKGGLFAKFKNVPRPLFRPIL